MKRRILAGAVLAIVAALIMLWPHPSRAQAVRDEIEAIIKEYLATHPDEIGAIVKDYLIKNPDVLRDVITELVKRRGPATAGANTSQKAADRSAAVTGNAALLFGSAHQVTLGNPDGDVTLVEFFDYNCGYCKRALADMTTLIKDDLKLKFVLKEFPILGPGSGEAARVAVAVRMQDPDGQKYLAFHLKLLGGAGPANKDVALAAAREQGLDMARLEQDMASDEVRTTIEEDIKLAQAVGINGTPGYVVGTSVVLGAAGADALKRQIAAVRAHRAD